MSKTETACVKLLLVILIPLTEPLFDHEKLDVYREAIAFCGMGGRISDSINRQG